MTSTPSDLVDQDVLVKAILDDLAYVAKTQDYAAPMHRVADQIRSSSLAEQGQRLRPSQKAAMLTSLRQAYIAMYASVPAEHAQGRLELTVSMNALGTLVLAWADDDAVWNRKNPNMRDAHDFAEAFGREMHQYEILEDMVARRKSMMAGREAVFRDLLTPPEGGQQ